MRDYRPLINEIEKAGSILIFTHANMDGDALGSSGALCLALRSMGKKAAVIAQAPCPAYLQFAAGDIITLEKPFDPDLCIAVDLGTDSRLEGLKDLFYSAPSQICIDHHERDEDFLTKVVVDPKAAAAGCLVFGLFDEMGHEPSIEEGELLYLAICTDTGSFKFGNTDFEAMNLAGRLLQLGVNHQKICSMLYSSYPLAQLKLEGVALDRATLVCGGKGIVSYVTAEDFERTGCTADQAETCIDRLRIVEGVELACILKQRGDVYKLSCRSKDYADARRLCTGFGGGGHIKASGATLDMPLEDALAAVLKAAEEELLKSLPQKE